LGLGETRISTKGGARGEGGSRGEGIREEEGGPLSFGSNNRGRRNGISGITAREVFHLRIAVGHEDADSQIAPFADAAIDINGFVFWELREAVSQGVHRDINSALNGAALEFSGGAHVHEDVLFEVEVGDFLPSEDGHGFVKDIACDITGDGGDVSGRREGR